jgi:cytosine deaminase
MTTDKFMAAAINEAKLGLKEGGIPIGSVLVLDGKIIGKGHNKRVQKGSAILHADPCDMCSGTILLYKIKTVIIGENTTFMGPEEYIRSRGVELINMNNQECKNMMREFIANHPELWNEDIGE